MAFAHGKLVAGPWPPDTNPGRRTLIDAWSALAIWHNAGEHITAMEPAMRSPAIAPDLSLADAQIEREGVCYQWATDDWIVLSRVAANRPIPISDGRVLAFARPLLCYVTEIPQIATGYINLIDQPTPKDLRLVPGGSQSGDDPVRLLGTDEISPEAIRLAKCLPYFYAQ